MYLYITYCPWDHIPRSFMCTFLGVFCLTSHFFHVHGFRVQQRPPKENHWELLKQFVLHADASCGPVNTVIALKVFLHKHKRTHCLAMLHKTLLNSVFVCVCVKKPFTGPHDSSACKPTCFSSSQRFCFRSLCWTWLNLKVKLWTLFKPQMVLNSMLKNRVFT